MWVFIAYIYFRRRKFGEESGTKMVKRANQFNSMINISQIYYTVFKYGNKVSECIKKA